MGTCIIRSIFGGLKILQADERIRIPHAVLDDICHPDVSYGDGILTIRAINGTVSYGVGPLDPATQTHECIRSGDLTGLPVVPASSASDSAASAPASEAPALDELIVTLDGA